MAHPAEKPPPIEKKPEERMEAEEKEAVEEIKVEKEIARPWEEMEREEEEKLIEKYAPKVELSKENQGFIDDSLRAEIEERKIEFAKDWFEEHKEELEAEGISLEVSEQMKLSIALEKGALEELKRKEEYREEFRQIEHLNVLRFDLGKKHLPIESRFLILNFLEKRTERINQEIQEMREQGRPTAEIAIKEKELDRLFEARKEVAEKASGRNLEEEAKEEIETKIEPKEKYVEDRLEGKKIEIENEQKLRPFEKEWQELSEEEKAKYENDPLKFADSKIEEICEGLKKQGIEINKDDYLALMGTGYNPEDFGFKGILKGKIEIKEGEIISKKEFPKFLESQREEFSKEIEKRAREDLGNQWEKDYQKLVREGVEERIRELAKSPEKAAEGIEGMYKKIEERLLAECVERDLKKEPKTREKLGKIEKEFGKGGRNPKEFIEDVLARKGPLRELTGNLEKDAGNLRRFLKDYGFEIKEEDLKKRINPERYKKEVKRERGFLELILELIFLLFTIAFKTVAEAEKEAKKRE